MLDSQSFGQGCEIKRILIVNLDELSFPHFYSGSQSTDEDVHSFELVLDVIKRIKVCLLDNSELTNKVLLGPALQLSAAEQDNLRKSIVLLQVVNYFNSDSTS